MNFVLIIASLLLDARFPDELSPHAMVGAIALGERLGRAADRLGADLEEPLRGLPLLEHALELLVQHAHDIRRRPPRRKHPPPSPHLPPPHAHPPPPRH